MHHLKSSLQSAAWQVRIVALAFIVISIASGSHVLVNAFASSTEANSASYTVTTITVPMHVAYSQHPTPHVSSKGYQPIGSSRK